MADDAGQVGTSAPPPTPTSRPVRIAGLLALTFVHPGIGQVMGAIDLPVSREAATGFPYIAGTSFKGALRDVARRQWGAAPKDPQRPDEPDKPSDKEKAVFGSTAEAAGGLIVSDIRLILLPVRSLDGAFRYVTCPQLIARFATDLGRAGESSPGFTGAEFNAGPGSTLAAGRAAVTTGDADAPLFLEEMALKRDRGFDGTVENVASAVCRHLLPQSFAATIPVAERLAVLTDDDFAWFARSALPVRMRNALDDNTKTVKPGHLWSEEYLAPDTVMYALLARRGAAAAPDPLARFAELMEADKGFVQIGGNETVGHGWFAVSLAQPAWPAAQPATGTTP